MTTPTLGPAGALRIAYELIDAQAAHIKSLERGHWSRETRAAVQDKFDEFEAARKAEELGSCCAAGACEPCEQEPQTGHTGNPIELAKGPDGGYDIAAPGARIDPGFTTISNPGDPGHPVIGSLEAPPRWASSPYATAQAAIELRRAAAPTEHTGDHLEGQWPPTGQCQRCDHLQPIWDEEQRLAAAASRRQTIHNHDPRLHKRDWSCPGCRP